MSSWLLSWSYYLLHEFYLLLDLSHLITDTEAVLAAKGGRARGPANRTVESTGTACAGVTIYSLHGRQGGRRMPWRAYIEGNIHVYGVMDRTDIHVPYSWLFLWVQIYCEEGENLGF